MITPADLFTILAPVYGEGGICINTDADKQLIIDELNQAVPMLLKRLDAKGTLFRWKVDAHGGCFCLPYDCLEVRQVFFNCRAIDLADEYYEGRIGGMVSGVCSEGPFIDLGDGYAIPYAWPSHHFDTRFCFMCEHDADAGEEVRVRFTNRYSHELDETLVLPPDQQIVISNSNVTNITFVRKPVTKGNVNLYVYYPQTKKKVRIAQYAPKVTIPSYRKKKMPGMYSGDLVIKGKKRFFQLRDENDVLPIDDIEALKWAFQALTAGRRGDDIEHNRMLAKAINELELQLMDSHASGAVIQMKVRSPYSRRAFRKCWA